MSGDSFAPFALGLSFYRLARPLLLRLMHDFDFSAMRQDFGLGTVAATNVGFALEFCLKALRVRASLPPNDTHDLWALYKAIPEPTKRRIERAYRRKVIRCPQRLVGTVGIQIGDADFPRPSAPPKLHAKPMLQRAGHLAVSWRYFYESSSQNGKPRARMLEPALLLYFAEAVLEDMQASEDPAQGVRVLYSFEFRELFGLWPSIRRTTHPAGAADHLAILVPTVSAMAPWATALVASGPGNVGKPWDRSRTAGYCGYHYPSFARCVYLSGIVPVN